MNLSAVCDAISDGFFGDEPLRCDMTGPHPLHHDPLRNIYWLKNTPTPARDLA